MYPLDWQYDYIDDKDGLKWAYGRLAECARDLRVLAVDTETEGLEALEHPLVLLQVATPSHAFLFPVGTGLVLTKILELLTDKDTVKLAQSAPFDWCHIKREFGVEMAPCFDTRKAAEARGIPAGKRGLKDLAYRFTRQRLDKGEVRTSFKRGVEFTENQERYSAIDALALWPVAFGLGLSGNGGSGMMTPADTRPYTDYLEGRAPWPSRPGPVPIIAKPLTDYRDATGDRSLYDAAAEKAGQAARKAALAAEVATLATRG